MSLKRVDSDDVSLFQASSDHGVINYFWLYILFELCPVTTAIDSEEKLIEMRRILTEELLEDNYFILKYIVQFLTEVCCFIFRYCLDPCQGASLSTLFTSPLRHASSSLNSSFSSLVCNDHDDNMLQVVEKCSRNKMNAQNLAIVFGPNLMWSKNQASLASVSYVITCTLLLITYYDDLFAK